MIRTIIAGDEPGLRAPRIRGDDPASLSCFPTRTTVLPASAGMIPAVGTDVLVRHRAPRIRGDDPFDDQANYRKYSCSPHPRG